MKNIINILAVLSLLFTANACQEGDAWKNVAWVTDEKVDIGFNGLSTSMDVAYKGASLPFTVNCSSEWAFAGFPSWVKVVDSVLVVEENKSTSSGRSCIIYITGKGFKIPISINQSKAEPYIGFSDNYIELSGQATSSQIQVLSNEAWSVVCNDSWVTISENVADGLLNVNVTANNNGYSRQATIYFTTTSGATGSVVIEQQEPDVTLSYEKLTVPRRGASGSINVECIAPFTVECTYSWIDYEVDAANPSLLRYTIQPNNTTEMRTGYLYIKVGEKKVALQVDQHPLLLSFSETSLTLPSAGGSKQFQIIGNDAWEINKTDLPAWLTIDEQVVLKDSISQITVTATENLSALNSRSYTLKACSKSNQANTAHIAIQQECKQFVIGSDVLKFSGVASTQTIAVKADSKWSAVSNESWITLKAVTEDNPSLVVTVADNPTASERNGSITFTMLDGVYTLKVKQLSKYMDINPSTATFSSKGGEYTIEIASDDTWSASMTSSITWLTFSSTSAGTGNGVLKLTATDNNSLAWRATLLTITTGIGNVYNVTITQEPRTLVTSRTSLLFPKRGGDESFTITTDGKFEVTKDVDWLSYRIVGNNVVVTAEKNSLSTERTGKLKIRLTDLLDGELAVEIPVTQKSNMVQVVLNGYGNDVNIDDHINSNNSITIGGYGSDVNLD